MVLTRPPIASLRPVVKLIWALDDTGEPRTRAAGRERVLPTGEMHLVFRLTAQPLRLCIAAGDSAGQSIGSSVVAE